MWLLTRPPSFSGSGLGISINEASRLNFAQIDNLLRPPTKKGLPANPEVEARRVQIENYETNEASKDIFASLKALGEI